MSITPIEIKEIRHKIGLSQQELSERLGLTRNAIAQWETGRCSPRGPAEILLRQLNAAADAGIPVGGK